MAEFIQTLEKVNRINKGYQGSRYTIIDGSYLIGRSLPYGNNTAVCWSALYELTTPEKIEEANITSLSVSQLTFTAKNGELYRLSGKLSGSGDGKIYGYFSEQAGNTNQFESYNNLLEKDAFVVKIYQEPFSSSTFQVSFDQPISIKPGTRYFLQLFTKETSRTLWYNWPTNYGKEDLTITYNYTTYTKFGDPSGNLKDSNENDIQDRSTVAPKSTIKACVGLPDNINEDLIDSIEITWEGAKLGKGAASWDESNEQSKNYIYQLSLDNSTRGSDLSVYAQIKHIGGSEYNSEKVRLGTVKINSLPVITGISFGGITIPAQSASTINITITSNDIDGQDLTYYWKNSSTSFIELEDNEVTVQKDQTFEIYADDGLERGLSFSCKIETNESIGLTINEPPTLTSFEYSYWIEHNEIGIDSYEGDGIPTHLRVSYKDKIGEWVYVGASEAAIPLTDLFKGLQGPFEFLQIDGKIVDDFGDASDIYSHFLQPDAIELEPDESSLSRYHFDISQKWQYELDSSEQESFYIDKTYSDNPVSGDLTLESYYLFAKDINALGSNKTQSVKAIMKWPKLENGTKLVDIWSTSLNFTTGQFVQFLDKPKFDFSTYNPFQAWLESSTTLQCNVSTTNKIPNEAEVILTVRNKELDFKYDISLTPHYSSSNYTWIGGFGNRQLYSWPGNTPVEGIYPFEITIKYKADDDSFIQSPAAIVSYDFNYVVPLLLPERTDEISIQEGDIPTVSINGLRIATQADLLFELQVDRGDGKGFVQYDNISYTTSGKLTKPYVPYVENGELKLPTIQDDPITFSPIGEVADTNNRIWRLVTKIANKEHYYGYSNTLETKVIQHTAPTNFVITNSTWQTQSSEAVLDFTINKNSNDDNIEIEYTIKEGAGSIEELGNNQLIFTPPLGRGGPYSISVKVETTLNGRTKEAVSNVFTIYVEGPTVSYRAHHLGVNSSTLTDDNVITIAPGSNARKMVYLKGADSNKISINLLNSTIDGSIINAGSWDGTDPGYIPIPSTGLAKVATSGELSDLEHTRSIVVIFKAGDSTSV